MGDNGDEDGTKACRQVCVSIWWDCQRGLCHRRWSSLEGLIWEFKEIPKLMVSIPKFSSNLVSIIYTPSQEIDVGVI